jgi:hypothetical protein
MNRKIFTFAAMIATAGSSAAFADGPRIPFSADAITWSQSMRLLKNNGYTHPVIVQSAAAPGGWIGSASKDGRRVDVAVDPEGKVTER